MAAYVWDPSRPSDARLDSSSPWTGAAGLGGMGAVFVTIGAYIVVQKVRARRAAAGLA